MRQVIIDEWLTYSIILPNLVLEVGMPLSIKNADVEKLVEEIAMATGESKTEAIRQALVERRSRLAVRIMPDRRRVRVLRFLEREIWHDVPARLLDQPRDRAFEDRVLGYNEVAK
jgi:antitoxin VapB